VQRSTNCHAGRATTLLLTIASRTGGVEPDCLIRNKRTGSGACPRQKDAKKFMVVKSSRGTLKPRKTKKPGQEPVDPKWSHDPISAGKDCQAGAMCTMMSVPWKGGRVEAPAFEAELIAANNAQEDCCR